MQAFMKKSLKIKKCRKIIGKILAYVRNFTYLCIMKKFKPLIGKLALFSAILMVLGLVGKWLEPVIGFSTVDSIQVSKWMFWVSMSSGIVWLYLDGEENKDAE